MARRRDGIEWIQVKLITFDPRVNRGVTTSFVGGIAETYDCDALGAFVVSRREDGSLVYIDGQHRGASMVKLGLGDQKVPCIVHEGLTLAQECALFIKLNHRHAVKPVVKFMRAVTAGDPHAVAIDNIVQSVDLKVHDQAIDGCVNAVASLQLVYHGNGTRSKDVHPEALRNTLRTLVGAYGPTNAAMNGYLIQGVGLVYLRYGDSVDVARAIKKLAPLSGGAPGLLGMARSVRGWRGGSLARAVAEVVVDHYNKGSRTGGLPLWREAA